MTSRRTEFTDFVLDLLDFMEEKLREALEDDASRIGAVGEAAARWSCCATGFARTSWCRPSLRSSSITSSTNHKPPSAGGSAHAARRLRFRSRSALEAAKHVRGDADGLRRADGGKQGLARRSASGPHAD